MADSMTFVSVTPLRERFLKLSDRGEITASEVALRCNWIRPDTGRPDSTRVKRALGLKECIARGGEMRRVAQSKMKYETAVLLAEAMNMDPYEAGV